MVEQLNRYNELVDYILSENVGQSEKIDRLLSIGRTADGIVPPDFAVLLLLKLDAIAIDEFLPILAHYIFTRIKEREKFCFRIPSDDRLLQWIMAIEVGENSIVLFRVLLRALSEQQKNLSDWVIFSRLTRKIGFSEEKHAKQLKENPLVPHCALQLWDSELISRFFVDGVHHEVFYPDHVMENLARRLVHLNFLPIHVYEALEAWRVKSRYNIRRLDIVMRAKKILGLPLDETIEDYLCVDASDIEPSDLPCLRFGAWTAYGLEKYEVARKCILLMPKGVCFNDVEIDHLVSLFPERRDLFSKQNSDAISQGESVRTPLSQLHQSFEDDVRSKLYGETSCGEMEDVLKLRLAQLERLECWDLDEGIRVGSELIQLSIRIAPSWLVYYPNFLEAEWGQHYGVLNVKQLFAIEHAAQALAYHVLVKTLYQGFHSESYFDLSVVVRGLERLKFLHKESTFYSDFFSNVSIWNVVDSLRGFVDSFREVIDNEGSQVSHEIKRGKEFSLLYRDDWGENEKIEWQVLLQDRPPSGEFSIMWPNGKIERYIHQARTPILKFTSLKSGFHISEGVLGTEASGILRPERYHVHGQFPKVGGAVLGADDERIFVDFSEDVNEILKDCIFFEAFDALYHRNYFHWLVNILSRIVFVSRDPMLSMRKIVLPENLTSWMEASLCELGFSEDDFLRVPNGSLRKFRSVNLISSLEVISPTLLDLLRQITFEQLQTEQGRSYKKTLGEKIFLRRNSVKRLCANSEDVENIFSEFGFVSFFPERFSFLTQASILSNASVVAGLEGAAFANTIFCPPGAKVISILSKLDMFPIFNEMSNALSHDHFKIACEPIKVKNDLGHFQRPYWVNVSNLRSFLSGLVE